MLFLIDYYEAPIYHGTTKENCNKIKASKGFKCKHRPDHWLGDGIYFFVNDYNAANWWAGCACKRNNSNRKSVLKFNLKMKMLNLLDLDSNEDGFKFNQFISDLKDNNVNISLNNEDKNYIKQHPNRIQLVYRSKYIKLYCEEMSEVKAVKYTFSFKNKSRYYLNLIGLRNHETQLNIVDRSLINFNSMVEC